MKKVLLVLVALTIPLSAMAIGIKVSWSPNSESDIGGYKIYYGTTSGTYPNSIDVGNVITKDIIGFPLNTKYYFALTAYDTSGNESGKSAEASITTPTLLPSAPTLVAGNKTFSASWTAVAGVKGYKVYIGTAPGVYGTPIDVGKVLTYTATGLTDKTTYFCVIESYDESNNAVKGAEASVTTLDNTAPNPPSKPVLSIWDQFVQFLKRFFRMA